MSLSPSQKSDHQTKNTETQTPLSKTKGPRLASKQNNEES